MWCIGSADTGDGKWALQDKDNAERPLPGAKLPQKLDVGKGTDGALVSTGLSNRGPDKLPMENTLWDIQYARAATIKPAPKGKTNDIFS
jgi:hypothetical protein